MHSGFRTDLETFLYSNVDAESDPEKRLRKTAWYFQHSSTLRRRLEEEKRYVQYAKDESKEQIMDFFKVYSPCIFVRNVDDCVHIIQAIRERLYPITHATRENDTEQLCNVVFCSFPNWNDDAQRSRDFNDAIGIPDAFDDNGLGAGVASGDGAAPTSPDASDDNLLPAVSRDAFDDL